mgnify:CR=1 FL=1
METFGFTKKKLLRLAEKNRHRHIIEWLTRIYQTAAANRMSRASLELFSARYNEVLAWSEMEPFSPPGTDAGRIWMEALSDRIHYHRQAAGRVAKDDILLEAVTRFDKRNEDCIERIACSAALDGIRSLFNAGSVIRSCEAAGFESVILGSMPDRTHPGIRKTAMGADEWIKIENTADLAGTLEKKKKAGYTIVGVETVENAVAYDRYVWPEKTVLVFGNEEYGISSHVMAACSEFVRIPMFGRKNSVNVANAASIIVFQAALAMHAKSGL